LSDGVFNIPNGLVEVIVFNASFPCYTSLLASPSNYPNANVLLIFDALSKQLKNYNTLL